MTSKLTGLGLFVRAPSEEVPQPTSIAIDLGLRAAVREVDNPWACHVTAALTRPGTDGLACHIVDVERLGELGRTLLDRLKGVAVCAAAVTRGGSRTWLIYAAGTDVVTVRAAVRSAVRLAFAEQSDYVPNVTVTADPAWLEYQAFYPTPGELREVLQRRAEAEAVAAARATTVASMAALRGAGVDMASPSTITYRLTFPTSAGRASFLERATACQFTLLAPTGPHAVSDEVDALTELNRDGILDGTMVHQIERWLIREAVRVGGRYLGWSTPSAQPVAMRWAA